jgi:hypothetical protein
VSALVPTLFRRQPVALQAVYFELAMKFLSILGGSRATPPEAANNSWVVYRSTGTVFVFVHGVQSSAKECWFNSNTGAFWPNLVRDDRALAQASIFLGGYYTQVDAGEYGMRDCAKELLEGLARGASGNPAVLDHERLVFVCHSLGGIVSRYMLECWREIFQTKSILLVLIASPSIGSQWANSLEGVIELFRNRTGRELRWKSDSLDDLDRRFKDMRDRQIIPHLAGCEWSEQKFPKVPGFVGFRPIVPVDSAARYFGDYHLIPGSDHISIVKPASAEERVHLLLRDGYGRFDQAYPTLLPPPPKPETPGLLRAPARDLFQCERMALTIRIYDDGDGHNQMAFEGIRALHGAEGAVYRLHRQWTDAGRTTDYVLQPAGTSAGVSLGQDRASANFDPPPSPERPQKLLIESLDAHCYAMDREELSQSGAPRADQDFAQFSLRWEAADTLVFQVAFPDSMSLTDEPPFVLAYQVFADGGQEREVFDSALTRVASEGFSYAPLLRTASLNVRRPPQRSAYRICWRLGDPMAGAVPATPDQLARLSVRRTTLLSVRDCFATSGAAPEAAARKAKIVDLVATIGDYVASLLKKTVAKTQADEAALSDLLPHIEITLMAVDPAGGRMLRFVASTSVVVPGFWDVKIPLGDGVAGRAARLLYAMTYDDEEVAGTVFAGVYKQLDPAKRHAWLLAVPLGSEDCGRAAIGILNVGIFDPSRAHMLKVLGQAAQLRELAAWANTEFLPKLLDMVSSNREMPES